MTMTKKPFNGMAIAQSVHKLASAPDNASLESMAAWFSALEEAYEFTDEQRQWLESMDPQDAALMLDLIKETIASRGSERIVVATVPDHTRPAGRFHELRKESVLETADNLRANLVIAHCDANCQNWGWGPG